MAKFYVQSGNIKTIVAADDTDKAALWVVHRTLQQVVPVYEDSEMSPEEKNSHLVAEGIMVLGNEILVSEIGFDRNDAQKLDTFELLVHWHQLMVALDRLASHLEPGQDGVLGSPTVKTS